MPSQANPSNSRWTILDTGTSTAEKNMAIDADLLAGLADHDARPTVHLYDWDGPSATYGHFIEPSQLLRLQTKLQLARRPTGGGIIFHLTDWAFSVLVPATHHAFSMNTLDNYAFVNTIVINAIAAFTGDKASLSLLPAEEQAHNCDSRHFCMAKPTRYDVMLNGRKVGGGAQRRTRHGFLHQGTISLRLPSEEFLNTILLSTEVLASMKQHTCPLIPNASLQDIAEARHLLAKHFVSCLS